MRLRCVLRLPGNLQFNSVISPRGKDGALDIALGSLVGVKGRVALVCELVIWDLFHDIRLAIIESKNIIFEAHDIP